MSAAPYMQLYVGDYLSDTLHLTTEQHGAYLLLLMTMWRAGAELPNDPAKLARITRVSPKRWASVWGGIAEFFTVDGDVIRNARLTKEHQKVLSLSQERKNAGSKGGTAKALKDKETALASATVLPWHSQISEPESYKEEGGGGSASASFGETFRGKILAAAGADPVSGLTGPNGKRIGTQADMIEAGRWITALGLTEAECLAEIAAVVTAKRDGPPIGFKYFSPAMARLAAAKRAPPPTIPDLSQQSQKGIRPNERAAFDRAFLAAADGVTAGNVQLDNSRCDPFAKRSGRDDAPGPRVAGSLLRPGQ